MLLILSAFIKSYLSFLLLEGESEEHIKENTFFKEFTVQFRINSYDM